MISLRLLLTFVLALSISVLLAASEKSIQEQHSIAYKLFESDPQTALLIGKETEKLAHQQGFEVLEANSIFIQAWVYKIQNEQGKRFLLYLKALEVLEPVKDSDGEATSLYLTLMRNTGVILKEHFAYPQASKYFDEALEIAERMQDYKMMARIFQNKASLEIEQHQHPQALTFINEGIKQARKVDDQVLLMDLLNERGLVQIELGHLDAARENFQDLIQLAAKRPDLIKYVGLSWQNIGYAYSKELKTEEAITSYLKANDIWNNSTGYDYERFMVFLNLSESYQISGDMKMAEAMGLRAIDLYPNVDLKPDHYTVFDVMSSIYFAQEQYLKSHENAIRYREENEKFLAFQDEMIKVKDQYKMEVLAAGFFVEKNSAKNENIYLTLITIISSIFTILLIAGFVRQHYKKQAIKKSILDIYSRDLPA
ncbi:hypothetical protein [Marinoscillum sp. MHG1-6]|uniref:hypothetical protein n=1 Tax=Marinoscillum sp. MHG1-6 TaxID=2959627 RepID=UPI002157A9A2|nr:hypothetical protein [Marinoscillum sp. MHG1-6]